MATRKVYHTQENRGVELHTPILCKASNAWLGTGYYFWYDMEYAEQWGVDFKCKYYKKSFHIYEALFDSKAEGVIDTVFNEEHYYNWLRLIEATAKKIVKRINRKPTIDELNDFFKEHNIWKDIKCIVFQDLPTNKNYLLVEGLYYKKRIQVVVFDLPMISCFKLNKVHFC